MLKWLKQWKRPIMGWTGLAAIVAGLLLADQEWTLRLAAITLGLALVCIALPPRVWLNMRGWWTS